MASGGEVALPRIRSVHPDICDDETLAEVTAYAERTFIRLWTHLDDKGRGVDNPKLWKGKLYPLHDDVTSDRVERDLTELAACGLLIRYEVDGKRYLCAKPETWAKYQKPQHPTPSKLPAPPEPSRSPHEGSPGSSSGVVVGEESSRLGAEGESEGEGPSTGARPQAVSHLAERAATAAARLRPGSRLAVVDGNPQPAAGAESVSVHGSAPRTSGEAS